MPKAGVQAPNEWGVNLDKPGTYYVVNTGTNSNPAPTPFTVRARFTVVPCPRPPAG